jgi:UDP-N-acetylglucosamine 2-epimerase
VGTAAETIVAAVDAFEAAGAALPQDRPQDLYGDGAAAEKIVRLLAR